MTSPSRELIYLGWQGFGNFGDDLIHDFWRAALGHRLSTEAPLVLRRYLKKQAVQYLRDRTRLVGRERAILLGGGTTVGFEAWAQHARLAQRMFGARKVLAAGAGSALLDDQNVAGRQPHDWSAWRNLDGFELLGVRGPLTAQECARELRPSRIIGDPALAYPDYVHVDPAESSRGSIGLCVGSEGRSNFDLSSIAAGVQQAATDLGSSIVLYQMTDADAPVNARLQELLGSVEIVRFDGNVKEMMNRIAGCTAFVSERLHGTIAAVSTGVAAVPLPYASKCDDFWLSVADERPGLRADSRRDEIAAAVITSLDPERLGAISTRAAEHRAALRNSVAEITAWLDGAERAELAR